jgi:stearoyl-CoA desaturase (delta-9 desaturase)
MPAQVASHVWGEQFWNAFFVAEALRHCIVLHFTWLVNSAAHLCGDHPSDILFSYPENLIVSPGVRLAKDDTTGTTSVLLITLTLNLLFLPHSTPANLSSTCLLQWG